MSDHIHSVGSQVSEMNSYPRIWLKKLLYNYKLYSYWVCRTSQVRVIRQAASPKKYVHNNQQDFKKFQLCLWYKDIISTWDILWFCSSTKPQLITSSQLAYQRNRLPMLYLKNGEMTGNKNGLRYCFFLSLFLVVSKSKTPTKHHTKSLTAPNRLRAEKTKSRSAS